MAIVPAINYEQYTSAVNTVQRSIPQPQQQVIYYYQLPKQPYYPQPTLNYGYLPPRPPIHYQPQPSVMQMFSRPVTNPAPLPKFVNVVDEDIKINEPVEIPKIYIDRDSDQQIKVIPIRERIRMNLEAHGMEMPTEEELEEIWGVKDVVEYGIPMKKTCTGITYVKDSLYRPWYDCENLSLKYPEEKEDMSEYDLSEEDVKEIERDLNNNIQYDNSDAIIDRDIANTQRNIEILSQQNPTPGVEVSLGYRTPDPPPAYNQTISQPISYQPPNQNSTISPFQRVGFESVQTQQMSRQKQYIPCANEISLNPYAFDDDESYYKEFERIRKAKCVLKMQFFEHIQRLRGTANTEEGKKQWREFNRLYGYRPLDEEAAFQAKYNQEEAIRQQEENKKMDDLSNGPWLGEKRLSNGDIVISTSLQWGIRKYDPETGEYKLHLLSKPNNPKTGYRIIRIDKRAQQIQKFNKEHWKDFYARCNYCDKAFIDAWNSIYKHTKYDEMSAEELVHGGLYEWNFETNFMPNYKKNMAYIRKIFGIRPKSKSTAFANSGINTRFGFAALQANSFIPNTNLAREYNCMRALDYGNGIPYNDSHLSNGLTQAFDDMRQRFFKSPTYKPGGYGVFEQRKQLPIGSFEPTTDMYNITAQEAQRYIDQINGQENETLQKAKMAISGALI